MRTWGVVNDILNQREELTPVPWLTLSHIIQQESQDLLGFLMDTLVGTQLTRSHGRAELVSHSHQRSVLLHQSIPKLSAPVCAKQHRKRPGPEEATAKSPAYLTMSEALQRLQKK